MLGIFCEHSQPSSIVERAIRIYTRRALPGFPRSLSSSTTKWVVEEGFKSSSSVGALNSVQPMSKTRGSASLSGSDLRSDAHRLNANETMRTSLSHGAGASA